MKVGHCSAVLFLALAVASLLGLSGCDSNSYSAAIRYLVRTDPLVTTDKLGPERNNPDRPGQLPILAAKDLLEFPNPYFKDAAQRDEAGFFERGKMIDPTKLSDENRKKLQKALDEHFGTPAEPKVDGVAAEVRDKLKLSPKILAKGSQYYRIHCLHCHGLTGNGRGPTSRWINPHPRDYRPGLFKFQSVNQVGSGKANQKPARADLIRTLEEGIEGTAMPAFNLLSQGDLESLVSYVIHLSIRGQVEYDTIKNDFELNKNTDELELKKKRKIERSVKEGIEETGKAWLDAQTDPIPVAEFSDKEMKASVLRGKALFDADEAFLKEKGIKVSASCVSCHKDYGRQSTFRFDEWGTLVKPADLTRGVYRGGRRPVDLYYRIHSGINGSGMANFGSVLKDGNQIWDIVNFVQVLPYKAMRDKFGIQID